MPTAKPRLMFPVDPDIAADIATIARLKGIPASRVVAEAIADMRPLFRETVVALEFIERAGVKGAQLAVRYTGDLKRKLDPALQDLDRALAMAVQQVERIEASRPKQVRAASVDQKQRFAIKRR